VSPQPETGELLNARDARRLDAQLDHLRRELSLVGAPPELEARLAKAFAAHRRGGGGAGGWRGRLAEALAPGAALAASMGLALWMLFAPVLPLGTSPSVPAAALGEPMDEQSPFIALQSLEQIALEPRARVVQTTVPRMILAAYGVPVSPEVAGETMRAEMLVSANGQPLAMRFIP
jgi:hypothetical protein